MILTCPSCEKHFQVPDGAIGAEGRKVRCSSCRHVWFQEPVTAPEKPKPKANSPESVLNRVLARPAPSEPDQDKPRPVVAAPAERPDPEPTAPPAPPPVAPPKPEPEAAAAPEPEPEQEAEAGEEAKPGDKPKAADDDSIVMPWPSHDDVARRPRPDFDITSESVTREAEALPPPRRTGGMWVLLIVVILAAIIVVGLYQWRHRIMQAFPQTIPGYVAAGLVTPAGSEGLKLNNVDFEVQEQGTTTLLEVTGEVFNTSLETRQLPELRGELLDADGQVVTFWVFAADTPVLGPGETASFHNTYRNPPITGTETDLFITFADLR
jgi:predicted Zn finger-like uncharacterized protein